MDQHLFVIMTYGESKHLIPCIESLKKQTVKSPIIITTSTPSDWLSGIAEQYHIPLVVRIGKPTIADDWNFAFSQGESKLITLVHQDDIYNPEYTSQMLRSFEKSPDMVMAFTDYAELVHDQVRYNNANLTVKRLMLAPFYLRHHYRSRWIKRTVLSFGNPICCPSVTYNREKTKDFKFDSSFSINLDWVAWVKLADMDGSFSYVPQKLVLHRIHDESETSLGLKENRRQEDDLKMFQMFWPKPIAKLIVKLYRLSYHSNSQ